MRKHAKVMKKTWTTKDNQTFFGRLPWLKGNNKKRFDLDVLHGVMCKHHFQVKLPAGNHRITVRLRGKLQTQTPGEAIVDSKTKL